MAGREIESDGGSDVQVFASREGREEAMSYAGQRYGAYVEKRLGALSPLKATAATETPLSGRNGTKEKWPGRSAGPSHFPESEPPSLPERRHYPYFFVNLRTADRFRARASIEIAIEGGIENRERMVKLLGT